jgi:hypothetical protein
MNRMHLSLLKPQLKQKRNSKLTQFGRLIQCAVVLYTAIPPGQFSIGANMYYSRAKTV